MDDIPELIQDTLPDLEILAPEFITAETEADPEEIIPELHSEEIPGLDSLPELPEVPEFQPVAEGAPQPEPQPEPDPEPEPVLVAEPAPEPAPELKPEPEPEPEVLPTLDDVAEDIPEWERDPTLAELRPDLDALEKAMAFAHGDADDAPEPEAPAVPAPSTPKVEQNIDEIPEITLDNAIQAGIENHLIDEPGEISPTAPEHSSAGMTNTGIPDVRIAPQKAKKADAEIERIAAELAKAKTIEDVDDRLAETLFGEEINLIASQVIAAGAASEPANDGELALFDTSAATMAQAAGSPHAETIASEEPSLEVSLETREHGGEAGLDLSASQRLKTVRALNADLHPSLREPTNGSSEPPAAPEPIEDQINTSMTQTLKALNVRPPISDRDALDDDDEQQKKGGFFSRFKRS
jgi:hypothetical protein